MVVDPTIETHIKEKDNDNKLSCFGKYAHPSGAVGFYFEKPEDHAGMTGAFKSVEQRDLICEKGAELIRNIVDNMDIEGYVEAMKNLDKETKEIILPKYSQILPKSKNLY